MLSTYETNPVKCNKTFEDDFRNTQSLKFLLFAFISREIR